MGDINLNQALRMFPPAQAAPLMAILRKMRRRLDQNYTSTTYSDTAANVLATLIAPAAEIGEGSVLHLRVFGTVRNNTGASTNCTVALLLEDNGLDLHSDTTAVVGNDSAGTESQAFIYQARIYYVSPTAIRVEGYLLLSADDQTAADAGTGEFTATAELAAPFVNTSTSGQAAMDHRITLTATLGSAAGANFDLTVLGAALWAE